MAKVSKSDQAKKQALEKGLRGMFGRLQARPVPERLISVVDQLEAAEAPPPKKAGRA